MRTWNYRIYETKNGVYGIIEVYYGENGEIVDWSTKFMSPQGNDFDSLSVDLDKMVKAKSLPVLKISDLDSSTLDNRTA